MTVNYDRLAESYKNLRNPDPRIGEKIRSHIENFRQVLNIGAGTGSYEPNDCDLVALEPSFEMISQRKKNTALSIQGVAEHLPFQDNAFEISLGLLTIHHWTNLKAGLKEMLRVSSHKVILLTWIGYINEFWLENYIPEIAEVDYSIFPTLDELDEILGGISVETVEIPYDCSDGFLCAYWRRPEFYLDPKVRKAISTFSRIGNIHDKLEALRSDIAEGIWRKKYYQLLEMESIDLGYRLVIHEKTNTNTVCFTSNHGLSPTGMV